MPEIFNPDIKILDNEYLGRTIIRPRFMTSVILNILRHYFTRPSLLVTERFQKKPNRGLEPDQHDNVLIISTGSWRLKSADERPALVVRRLEWRPIHLGMGDGQVRYDPANAQAEYMIAFQGGHAIYAHSREQGEVEALVEEVINCFLRMAPFIRRMLRLARFRLVNVDKVSMYTMNRDYFVCPMMLQYTWSENWFFDKNSDEMERIVSHAIALKEQ